MARFFNLSYSSHVLSIESRYGYAHFSCRKPLVPLLSLFFTYRHCRPLSLAISADRTKQSLSIDFPCSFFIELFGNNRTSAMRKFSLRNNFNIKSDVVRTSKSVCLSEIYTRKLITQVSQSRMPRTRRHRTNTLNTVNFVLLFLFLFLFSCASFETIEKNLIGTKYEC